MKYKKVIVTDVPTIKNRWYRHFIGTTFTVKDNDRPESYIVIGMLSEHDSEYRIEKTDCKIIEESTSCNDQEKVRIFIRDNYDLALWEIMDDDWIDIFDDLLQRATEPFNEELRAKFFEECVSSRVEKSKEGIAVSHPEWINYTPHDLFEWFKRIVKDCRE